MKVDIGPYPKDSTEDRVQSIVIEPQDTWSMDYTLGLIILPMLKQLKATSHGSPCTDDEDVPEFLRSTSKKENKWDIDELHIPRWTHIMNEMIWAFEQITNENHDKQFFKKVGDWKTKELSNGNFEVISTGIEIDKEGLKVHNDRIANGLRLFGKYYRALWD